MRKLGAGWAIGGFSALMLWAIWRLSHVAADALTATLGWPHWLLLIAFGLFMAYTEGYRGFQLGYSPRLARRVGQILDHGRAIDCILAPLYAMGFYAAPRRRLITTYLVTIGIIALIVLFHQISQPWRGILDLGVVIGLGWGLIASWAQIGALLTERPRPTEEYP